MVDEKTKQKIKIKYLWCVRLSVIVTLSFSIIKVPLVLQANQKHNEDEQAYEASEEYKEDNAYKALKQALKQADIVYQPSRQVCEASNHAYNECNAYKEASREASEALKQADIAYQAFRQRGEGFSPVIRLVFEASKQEHEASEQVSRLESNASRQMSNQEYDVSNAYDASLQAQQASKQVSETYKASLQVYEAIKQPHKAYEQTSKLKTDLQSQSQNFKRELSTLGISALGFIVMLIVLVKQRNQISLSLTGQLICFIPEECVAEIEVLRQQLKSEHLSTWFIRIIILKNVLELFFAFYIQINLENLWLSQHKGHKNIDE